MNSKSNGNSNRRILNQDQDQEEFEINVVLKLPKGYYKVVSGLTELYDYENSNEYVNHCFN
jgi:hypothetical protein